MTAPLVRFLATLGGLVGLGALLLGSPAGTLGAGPLGGGMLPNSAAQSRLVDDPAKVAAKEAGQLTRQGNLATLIAPGVTPSTASNADPSLVLDTSVSGLIVEQRGDLYDDLHHLYGDRNYWNFCAAGAATVATYYWTFGFPAAGYFTEPYGPHTSTTYWRSSDTGTSSDTSNGYGTNGRNYVIYMAEKVLPPTFGRPGIDNFDSYPTTGGSLPDMRDAVNWESTNHSPDWETVGWYTVHSGAGTQTELVNNVKTDVFWNSTPVIASVHTYVSSSLHLPNWTANANHAITIVGYNDTTSTFTYLDTCGKNCNVSSGNHNGGTYTVSYSTMYQLIKDQGYGYVW